MEVSSVRQWTVILLIACMMFTSCGFVYAGESDKSDVKGHWAESQLNQWIEKGFIHGYADGTIKPNNSITRAELTVLVNRAFGFAEKANVSFTDINSNSWSYDEVAKAVKGGYMQGNSDGTFGADDKTSRQEVAVIIARLLKLQSDDQATAVFRDKDQMALWSRGAIGTVATKKLMLGYGDQTFKPEASITRAEVVVTLDRAQRALTQAQAIVYQTGGTYGPASGEEIINGDVVVSVPGVTLQNMVIGGDLSLAEGIGSGDAFMKNVTVKGKTNIQGGGEHSIHAENSTFVKIIVNKKDGTVRLVVEGTTTIGELIIESPVILELGKDSKIITLMVDAVLKALGKGTIEKANIGSKGKNSTFEKLPQNMAGNSAPTPTSSNSSSGSNNGGNNNPETPTPPVTVSSVAALADIVVDNGTSLLTVLTGLPTTVQLTLNDSTTKIVNVTWNGGKPAYNGSQAGTYIFSGTPVIPSSISNPNGVQATIHVIVAAPIPTIIVTSADTLADIVVDFGTSVELPQTVGIKLSDNTTSMVNVQWDAGTPVYNENQAGTYTFTGTPLELPIGVSNPNHVTAIVKLVVEPLVSTITVTSADVLADIEVDFGTPFSSIGLPTTVLLTLSDNTTPTVNVQWNAGIPLYNDNQSGTYTFTGTLLGLPIGVSNQSNVQASVKVVVAKSPAEGALAVINANVVSAIQSGLPATFTLKNLVTAGVTNTDSTLLSYYQDQVTLARIQNNNKDLLLTDVQSAINKINADATLIPAAAAILPVNHFNNQVPGNDNLESGDLILLAFNVKLKMGAVSAIQAAVDTAFGTGNATVTTGNNITFNIIVNDNKNIALPQQSVLITLAANTVQNYIDGTIENTAPINFTIEDSLNPTP